MFQRLRHRRVIRIALALALGVIAILRDGGIALACDVVQGSGTVRSAPASHRGMRDMPDMADMLDAGTPDEHRKSGCDTSDQRGECWLMVACAPALSAPRSDRGGLPPLPAARAEWRVDGAPSPADFPPEPPPPRS